MQLGFFIPLLFKGYRKLINTGLSCVFIIICIEMGQFILNVGVLDIDDIILNTIGCILGFAIFRVSNKLWVNI